MNRRILRTVALLGAMSAGLSSPAFAQSTGFSVGYTDIGPTIGLGGLGSAGMSFGGRFERAIKTLPSMNNGVLGIQASFDYYSYDNRYAGVDYGFSYMPIGVTGNYHFQLQNKKIDPFLGLGLGYIRVSTKYGGTYDASHVYFIGRAGIRYFWKPRMALYADAGAGAAALNAGVTFGIGGGK